MDFIINLYSIHFVKSMLQIVSQSFLQLLIIIQDYYLQFKIQKAIDS